MWPTGIVVCGKVKNHKGCLIKIFMKHVILWIRSTMIMMPVLEIHIKLTQLA